VIWFAIKTVVWDLILSLDCEDFSASWPMGDELRVFEAWSAVGYGRWNKLSYTATAMWNKCTINSAKYKTIYKCYYVSTDKN